MLLGQWGKFLVLTKIGGYASKSICFFFLQEELRLLLLIFCHLDFFVIFEALVDVTSELWALHFKKTKQNKVSLCSPGWPQTPNSPAFTLHPSLLDGHHQARQHHLFHSLAVHTLILQVAGWQGDTSSQLATAGKRLGRTVYGIVFSSPISKPACQKPKPSMFLSILERGQHRVRHVHQFPRLEQAPTRCSLPRSSLRADSQPVRFHPEMKIAITLLLLHSAKVDF